MPTISFAAAAGCALTVLAEKATIVSSAVNVKTALILYVSADKAAQTAQLSVRIAAKNAKPVQTVKFAVAVGYALSA